MWLTAVGAVFFLLVGLIWGLAPSSSDEMTAVPESATQPAEPEHGGDDGHGHGHEGHGH